MHVWKKKFLLFLFKPKYLPWSFIIYKQRCVYSLAVIYRCYCRLVTLPFFIKQKLKTNFCEAKCIFFFLEKRKYEITFFTLKVEKRKKIWKITTTKELKENLLFSVFMLMTTIVVWEYSCLDNKIVFLLRIFAFLSR